MIDKKIKFSIMSPVYNVEKYLDACIESVLNQTYKNYELILIDDGSTDGSGKKCDEYAAKYSQIKVFHKENGGVMSARRYALDRIEGGWCVFLDSDDILENCALEKIYNYIMQYDCDCIVYRAEKVLKGESIYTYKEEENAPFVISDKKELYKKVFFSSNYNNIWRKAVKRSVFAGWDYSPFFHISMGEDLLQSLEIYKNANKFLFVNDSLYRYRLNSESITQKYMKSNYRPDFTVSEEVLKFIISEDLFSEKDMNEYRDYNIKLLLNEVIAIGENFPTYKKQKEHFKTIINSEYYKTFLSNGLTDPSAFAKKKYVYYLLKHKMFFALFVLFKLRNRKHS